MIKMYNIQKFGKSKYSNVLFVTGLSGAGKTTICNKYFTNKSKFLLIELDSLKDSIGDYDDSYLYKLNPDVFKFFVSVCPNYLTSDKRLPWEGHNDRLMEEIIMSCISVSEYMYMRYKVVIDGLFPMKCQNLFYIIKNYPIIIPIVSAEKAAFRGVARDHVPSEYHQRLMACMNDLDYQNEFISVLESSRR